MIHKIINFFLSFFRAKKEIKTEVFLGYKHSQEELEILKLINEHRLILKLRQLYTNSYLSFKCEEHNLNMIKSEVLSHNGFVQRCDDIINFLKCENVAENLGYNYKSTTAVVDAWLKSESHKENIYGDFIEFGISARKDLNGKTYYTNIFIK